MSLDPIDGVGAARPGAAATGLTAGVPASAASQSTLPAASPDADRLFAAKQGLDQREEAYQGIVGSGGTEGAKGAAGSAGAIADKTGDQVSDAELKNLFGGDADKVRDLLKARSDMRVGDILPLRKDPEGLDATAKLLTGRSDLKFDDVLQRGQDGKIKLNPTLRDENSRDLMMNRTDVRPQDLSNMAAQYAQAMGNPAMARQIYQKSIELLKTRTDVKPQDMGQMVASMGKAVNPPGGANGNAANAGAIMDMFNNATDLMKTRTDLGPADMGKLAEQTGKTFGGQKDGQGASNISNAFGSATKLLQSREGMPVSQVTDLMGTIQERFPGDGAGAAADKVSAFDKATTLMANQPRLDARGVDTMFRKAAEGPPPLKGDKLLFAFDSAAHDLQSGKTNVETATGMRAQQTDRQVREEKALRKDDRIQEGRLPTPQEERDTELGRNDASGKRPETAPEQGARAPGETPAAGASTGAGAGHAPVDPREGALESLDPTPGAGGATAGRPQQPGQQT